MGLTIHYEAKDKKAFINEKTILDCVSFIRKVAELSKWEILANIDETVNPSLYEKSSSYDEVTQTFKKQPNSTRTNARSVLITIHPHKDCESLTFGFDVNAGKFIIYEEYRNGGKYSSTTQFCKTHYAGFQVHKKVCKLLDAISKNYFELEVHDEGDYYGIWDEEKGKKNFGEYVAFVHNIGNMLKDTLGTENLYSSEDHTDGWKDDYLDSLVVR